MARVSRTRGPRRGLWGLVALSAALALADAAHAQSNPPDSASPGPDRGTAAALFDEGRKLVKAGKYAEACPKLEAAQRIKPGIGILFNLADCYEHVEKTASAWLAFRDVAAQANAQARTEQEKDARARIAAIEPKLVRLTIVVQNPPKGLVVKRDGEPVADAVWGVAVPVDPGEHVVEASAPGKETVQIRATAKDPGTVKSVEVPALADAPTTAPLVPTASPSSSGAVAPPPAGDVKRGWQKPLGFVAMGAGAIGVGVGIALGFGAKSALDASNADGHCVKNACDAIGTPLRNDAVSKGNVATIVVVAGAVVAAGGLVLVLTAPSPGAAKTATAASLRLSLSGASLGGTF